MQPTRDHYTNGKDASAQGVQQSMSLGERLAFTLALALQLSTVTAASRSASSGHHRPLPQYSECFTVRTHEVDTPTNTTVLRQVIAQDDLLRRSSMTATGSLVRGFMQ